MMRNGRLAPLFGAFLLIAGCAAPGDTFDKWFGPGPVQKPNELVNFKPVATAKVIWRASVSSNAAPAAKKKGRDYTLKVKTK